MPPHHLMLCVHTAVARLGPEVSRQLPSSPFQTVPSTVGGDTLFGSLQPLHLQAGPLQQPPMAQQQAMVSTKQCATVAPSRQFAEGRVPSSGAGGLAQWQAAVVPWVAQF